MTSEYDNKLSLSIKRLQMPEIENI
jgi:hypothetical protein